MLASDPTSKSDRVQESRPLQQPTQSGGETMPKTKEYLENERRFAHYDHCRLQKKKSDRILTLVFWLEVAPAALSVLLDVLPCLLTLFIAAQPDYATDLYHLACIAVITAATYKKQWQALVIGAVIKFLGASIFQMPLDVLDYVLYGCCFYAIQLDEKLKPFDGYPYFIEGFTLNMEASTRQASASYQQKEEIQTTLRNAHKMAALDEFGGEAEPIPYQEKKAAQLPKLDHIPVLEDDLRASPQFTKQSLPKLEDLDIGEASSLGSNSDTTP